MANTMGNYLQSAVLSWLNGTAMPTAPTSVYVALFTSAPTNAGGGTEVSGGDYARATVAAAGWTKSGTSPTQLANTSIVDFGTASAGWGTVTDFAIFDASTSGNLLMRGTLTASKAISSGDPVSFQPATLLLQLD